MASKREPAAEQYTASDIQVLEGLEAVRRRPGMYIGGTDERGLHHLVFEIADNSIDEAMAGHCDRIWVHIAKDGRVTVRDNGWGIPIDTHEKTGKSALETVMTVLHAGGKFGGQVYKVSGGLHGVGASVVNALSENMWVEVRRNKKLYRQEYVRGIPTAPIQTVKTSLYEGPDTGDLAETGTTTSFVADREIFIDLEFDPSILIQRFREACYLTKGVWLAFSDERSGKEFGSVGLGDMEEGGELDQIHAVLAVVIVRVAANPAGSVAGRPLGHSALLGRVAGGSRQRRAD